VSFGPAFRAESARIGIGETIAVGRILYASDVPLIVLDETWIPAKEAVTAYTIMSFGEIDVYIGFAEPAQPTPAVMIEAEEFSGPPLSAEAAEFRISENPNPTQPAPVAEIVEKPEPEEDLAVNVESGVDLPRGAESQIDPPVEVEIQEEHINATDSGSDDAGTDRPFLRYTL